MLNTLWGNSRSTVEVQLSLIQQNGGSHPSMMLLPFSMHWLQYPLCMAQWLSGAFSLYMVCQGPLSWAISLLPASWELTETVSIPQFSLCKQSFLSSTIPKSWARSPEMVWPVTYHCIHRLQSWQAWGQAPPCLVTWLIRSQNCFSRQFWESSWLYAGTVLGLCLRPACHGLVADIPQSCGNEGIHGWAAAIDMSDQLLLSINVPVVCLPRAFHCILTIVLGVCVS